MRVLWTVLILLGVSLFGTIVVYTYGEISGQEFSPDLFQRRTFSYYELPVLKVQISPIVRLPQPTPVESFLATKTYVTPVKTSTPRWDLVKAQRSDKVFREDDAAILCVYLDMRTNGGKFHWEVWSDAHPELAKVFWKGVSEVVRNQLYTFLPDLVRLATKTEDADELQTEVDGLLVEKYRRLAEWQQQQNNHAIAVEIFTAALDHAPNDEKLQHGLQKSRTAIQK